MSNKTNNQYFEMINKIIDQDKAKATEKKIEHDQITAMIDNVLTATECARSGYTVACTACGQPTCNGEYSHYETN